MFTVEFYLKVSRAHFQDGFRGRQIARDFAISRDSFGRCWLILNRRSIAALLKLRGRS